MVATQDFLMTESRIRRDLDTLAARCAAVAEALARVGYPPVRQREPGFATLARIVIGQQVSVAAAASIAARVEEALGGSMSAQAIEGAPDETLRAAGLSRQKVSYLRALAEAVVGGQLDVEGLARLADDDAVARITAVKGFGVWSAHMYLMFSLGRPDVWPSGDLAVRLGFARLQGWEHRPAEREVKEAGTIYSPQRSALALLCWRYYSEVPL